MSVVIKLSRKIFVWVFVVTGNNVLSIINGSYEWIIIEIYFILLDYLLNIFPWFASKNE